MENYSFSLKDFRFDFEKDILGKGKSGYVYKAYCIKYDRYFALKMINKSEDKDEQIKQSKNVKREYETMKKMSSQNSENLEKVYGSFEEKIYGKDCYFFVLELIDGKNLFNLIDNYQHQKKYIEQNLIMKIFFGVANGLYQLHSNGITHRDISPDNIMIDKNNRIIITDFGLSAYYIRYKDIPDELHYHQSMVGKVNFVGTEIIKRMELGDLNILYDEKNDIFAFGVTMYYLMAYGYPKCIKSRIKDFNKYKIVENINEKIYTKNLINLVMTMIDNDPKKRPNCYDIFHELLKIRKTNSAFSSVIKCLSSFDQLDNYLLKNEININNNKLKKPEYKFNKSFIEALKEAKEYELQKSERIYEFIITFYEKILFHDINGTITPINIIQSIFDYFMDNSPFIYNNTRGHDFSEKTKNYDFRKNTFIDNKIKEFELCYKNIFVSTFYFLVRKIFKCKNCKNEIGQDLEIKFNLDLLNNEKIKSNKISDLIKYYLEQQTSLNLGKNSGGYSLTCKHCGVMPKFLDEYKKIIFNPEILIVNLLSETKLERYIDIDNIDSKERYELKAIIAYNNNDKIQTYECGFMNGKEWLYFSNDGFKSVNYEEIENVRGVNIAFYCIHKNEFSIFPNN